MSDKKKGVISNLLIPYTQSLVNVFFNHAMHLKFKPYAM
jgi:hypothetical protein